jgi:predicted dehydrogenase
MKWGIIGFGEIAPSFIQGLTVVKGQYLSGIASVSKHKTLVRENKYPNTKIYSEYTDLLDDSSIDIVYICTTNNLHKQNVLAALKAGKNVLCEKPMSVCKADVEEMIAEAQKQNKFLMEGMWTRFLPAYQHFKALLKLNVIGKINFIRVDFGFYSNWNNERRLKNKDLYGGTLLDNADYNIFLCQDIFIDKPSGLSAFARIADTKVEDMCGIMLQYASGSIAQLFSSFQQKTRQEALIYGENGYFHLTEYWHGTIVELYENGSHKKWEFPFRNTGFEYEIEEVVSCINAKKIESEIITHSMSIQVAEMMDNILEQIKISN